MDIKLYHKIYKQLNYNLYCKKCGNKVEAPILKPRPDTMHGNEIRCEHCQKFLGWTGKDYAHVSAA